MLELHSELQTGILQQLQRMDELPSLQWLRLAGLNVTGTALLAVLRKHYSLQDFQLDTLDITAATLESVLDYLANDDCDVKNVQLEGPYKGRPTLSTKTKSIYAPT